MSKWFYYNGTGEKIEVTSGQLKKLAMDGVITPETIIETEDGKSAPASNVRGLLFPCLESGKIESDKQQPNKVKSILAELADLREGNVRDLELTVSQASKTANGSII